MPLYSFKHPKSNPTRLVSVVKDSVHQEKEIEYKFECPLCLFKTDMFSNFYDHIEFTNEEDDNIAVF